MKKILYLFITFILVFSFSVCSYSYNYSDDVFENIDDSTKEYLNELGLDEISFEKLYEMTPSRVLRFILDLVFNKTTSLSNRFVLIFFVMLVSSISSAFLNHSTQLNKIIDYISILVILSFFIDSLSRIVTDAAVSLKTTNIFINSYLPVMIGIIVASRNPALAVTYNSFTIILSNVISFFSDKLLVPLIGIIFSFNIISSISDDDYHLRINKIFRKLVIVIISLFSTIYTSLLSMQSVLASSSDSFALKGIKFLSGTFIPVVGNNVSDAVTSVVSSFLMMKSTLGVFIIVVILLINLPVMVELLVWYFFFNICSIISSLLKLDSITNSFDCISSTISLLNIVLFFITFVLVISTGIIIVMGK